MKSLISTHAAALSIALLASISVVSPVVAAADPAPTTPAVRRFLKEFLWDPRVVNLPRPLWWVILHFFVS